MNDHLGNECILQNFTQKKETECMQRAVELREAYRVE